ncbi:MAG: DUF1499 domain-containing protein [Burkholderiaceae bacterium]|nr:DUF1499 domain-containing protein [Burkholderiaceae bacterium]
MNWLVGIVIALAALGLLTVAAGQLGFLRGKAPADLGVHGGRLKRPSATPNSVSSQADLFVDHPMRDYARIAPLPAAGGAQASMARLRAVIERLPGAHVVEQRDDYLYARFETRLLRFTDDAEFWYDPGAQAIQVRSASRLGRKDFGVNRARIEAIRAQLLH